jgi:hypothetical protein
MENDATAALLWLNDRLGKRVTVWVGIERGDLELCVIETQGELRHWTESGQGQLTEERESGHGIGRDEVAGLYDIGGGVSLDLSDVRPLEVSTPLDDHLTIRHDENTTLQVVEQEREAVDA